MGNENTKTQRQRYNQASSQNSWHPTPTPRTTPLTSSNLPGGIPPYFVNRTQNSQTTAAPTTNPFVSSPSTSNLHYNSYVNQPMQNPFLPSPSAAPNHVLVTPNAPSFETVSTIDPTERRSPQPYNYTQQELSSQSVNTQNGRPPQTYNYTQKELGSQSVNTLNTSIYPNINNLANERPNSSGMKGPFKSASKKDDFVLVGSDGKIIRKSNAFNNRGQSSSQLSSCPACSRRFVGAVYQCGRGHSACAACKDKPCAICGESLTGMRNFALEDYIAGLKIPCPNAQYGCKLVFKLEEEESHMQECPFGDMHCPIAEIDGKCQWKGKSSQLVAHFEAVHPTCRGDVGSEMSLPTVYFDLYFLHLVTLGSYNFIVHVKVSEIKRTVMFAVQLIGTKMSAAKWFYEMHVFNKSEPRRKYFYSDVCRPTGKEIATVLDEGMCAVLPLPYAVSFLNNGTLAYKFYIKQFANNLSQDKPRSRYWKNNQSNKQPA